MSRIFLAAALACMVPAANVARGDVIGLASEVGGNLDRIDLTTGTLSVVGNTGVRLMEGLALNSAGALYGTDDAGVLRAINTATAATTTIGVTGLGNIEGLSFRGNTLIGTDFNNSTSFYTIDTGTAAVTRLVTSSYGGGVSRALTLVDATTAETLVGTSSGQALATTNLSTGATTLSGTLTTKSLTPALARTADGTLYALDLGGNEYTLAPSGAATLIANFGSRQFLDLTLVPQTAAVPEPSTLALAGLAGLLALGSSRRRRR